MVSVFVGRRLTRTLLPPAVTIRIRSFTSVQMFHTHTHLCHTLLCHTQLCHIQLCHIQLVTYNVSHTTLSHTTLSHTALSHTSSFTNHFCHTPSFTHHLCHTPSFTPSVTHTTLSHTIFHTQLRHRQSFTHILVTHHLSHTLSFVTHHLAFTTLSHTIFVTHHLSHTTWLHTIFATHPLPHTHTQLFHTQHCHTPSFTHNFSTHNSSHTTFLDSSIIHHLPCLSCLPRPAATLCSDYWKTLTCGVIRSFNFRADAFRRPRRITWPSLSAQGGLESFWIHWMRTCFRNIFAIPFSTYSSYSWNHGIGTLLLSEVFSWSNWGRLVPKRLQRVFPKSCCQFQLSTSCKSASV